MDWIKFEDKLPDEDRTFTVKSMDAIKSYPCTLDHLRYRHGRVIYRFIGNDTIVAFNHYILLMMWKYVDDVGNLKLEYVE